VSAGRWGGAGGDDEVVVGVREEMEGVRVEDFGAYEAFVQG
jgi:hypothetical protein